jgi:hypothetical protein
MGAATSIGLSLLFDSKSERAAMFLAFGLSLSLFGLTTLEALPVSTQTLLSHQGTLAFAYWISLWLLSIYIVFVVPSLVGASVAISFRHYFCCTPSTTKSESKKYTLFDPRRLPWWIRFMWGLGFGLVLIIFKKILYNGLSWCCYGRQRQNPIDSTVLPLHEAPMVRSLSQEMMDESSRGISPSNNKRSSVDSARKKHDYSTNYYTLFAAIGGICGIILVLGIFSTIGPLVVQLPSIEKNSILSQIVSWICAMGLVISSILNGFGSVSLPYTTLSGFFLPQVRPDYVTNLEGELNSLRSILFQKKKMVKELKVSTNQSSLTGSSGTTFSVSSLLTQSNTNRGFSDIGVELRERRQILNTEIIFIEDMVRETTLDLEELKNSQMTAAAARTSIGKTKLYIGLVFSIILLIRLFNAGHSIYRSLSVLSSVGYAPRPRKKSRSDIVTSILFWLSGHHHVSHHEYNMLSQMVSLVLSAVLSFTQVRIFLRTATIVHHKLSRLYNNFFYGGAINANGMRLLSKNNHLEQNPTVNFFWRITSALLGCYSLACIVLIKMMLPERFSVAFSMALDETSIFTVHSSSVDTVYFSSAVVSTSIFGILLGIQRQNIARHANILSERGSNVKSYSLPDV